MFRYSVNTTKVREFDTNHKKNVKQPDSRLLVVIFCKNHYIPPIFFLMSYFKAEFFYLCLNRCSRSETFSGLLPQNIWRKQVGGAVGHISLIPIYSTRCQQITAIIYYILIFISIQYHVGYFALHHPLTAAIKQKLGAI